MTMGIRRSRQRQEQLWINHNDLAKGPGHRGRWTLQRSQARTLARKTVSGCLVRDPICDAACNYQRLKQMIAAVQLIKALVGGWTLQSSPPRRK